MSFNNGQDHSANPEVVKVLLENGADALAVDEENGRYGSDALSLAQTVLEEGDRKDKIIQILKGVPSVQGAMREDAFRKLCEKGTADEVRKALDSGINVHARGRDNISGNTALMSAAYYNSNPEVVKVLLANGADIHARNKDGETALMWAAGGNSNPKVVKALLISGADINAQNKWGTTALMWAAKFNSNPEVVKVLLENGADVHAINKDKENVFDWAQRREKGDKEKIIQMLKRYY